MTWLRVLALRFSDMFGKRRRDAQLEEELQSHLEMLVEQNLQRGMPDDEARRAARIELGGHEQIKEAVHDHRGLPFLESLIADIRFALRMLRKSPGFTAVVILTLALGIGVNTAIFSIVNRVMLRMLPVKDPRQLVLFTWDSTKEPPSFSQTGFDIEYSFSYPQFEQFQQQKQVLSDVFAFVPLGFSNDNITVNANGQATPANGVMVSGSFFSGLGVTPIAGRAISDADEQPGAPRVAVISYAYWNSRFARAPGVVGSNITINNVPFTIVGIAPFAFSGVVPGERPDIWIAFDDLANLRPWSAKPPGGDSVYATRSWLCLDIMGRLKPGVSPQQAQAALDIVYRQFITEDWKPLRPEDVPGFSLTPAAQGMPHLRKLVSQPLLLLMGAVGVVLLIACANVATLLLARASTRRKEISVRLAMGASRSRLIRQLLTESIMMSLAGGALAFFLAKWGTQAMLVLPTRGQYAVFVNIAPDTRVLFFTLCVSLLTGILFGIAPALRTSRVDLSSTMKGCAPDLLGDCDKHRLGQSLVVVQIAGCLMLMIAAGLFVRTLVNFVQNSFGFNQSQLLTFGLDPAREGYHGDMLINFYSQLLARVQSLPGVNSATMIEFPPFSVLSNNSQVTIVGSTRAVANPSMRWQTVGPDFFRTMQIPLLSGRGIQQQDTANAPDVVVVDETFAKNFFGNENPLGQRLQLGEDSYEIIGVAKPAELTDVHDTERSKAYFSYMQLPQSLNSIYFEIRSSGYAQSVISEVREAVRESDPNLPLLSLATQTDLRDDALTGERIIARLSAFFGILALTLAVIGLYGTIAYAVTRKTHEIGIRMALGAAPADVLRLVVAQGIKLAGLGIAVGVVAALAVTRLIHTLIFGVAATDPLTFIGVAVLLSLVALAACYIPARRASKVDPMIALRYE